MSIQLILYPQSFNGLNPISGNSTEFVVDGIDFNTLNATTSLINLAQPTFTTAINQLAIPMVINTWYRFSGDASGVSYASGFVIIGLRRGLIQKLSNLIIGQTYNVNINTSGTVSNLFFKLYNGTALQNSTPITISGTNSLQFTATSTNTIIMLYSEYNSNFVTSVSIQQAVLKPSGAIQDLGNGQVILDLYEDEDIPLSLSIDDFKNVAEKVQSYSKAFKLPGTKRNNQIFDNIFEITRSDDGVVFNPYVKTQCELKQDGFILFEGYLKLIDIQDQLGEISYNINLYSEVIALADVLKEKTFSDLNFSELKHDYNRTNIQASWSTGVTYTNAGTSGFRNANTLKYPFVDWNHQIGYDSNNFPVLPNLETVFRPFITLKYLIQRIFDATPFTFTSEFFDTSDFLNLYMDFNWGSGGSPSTSNQTVTGGYFIDNADNYAPNGSYSNLKLTFPSGNLAQVNYDTTTNKITATSDNTLFNISYSYEIKILNVTPNPLYSARWLITKVSGTTIEVNLVPIQTIAANQTITFTGTLSELLDSGDTLEAQFYSNGVNVIVQNFDAINTPPLSTANVVINKSILSVTTNIILQTLRGELEQWEFLKGIMTMFNLVSIPDKSNPNNILIEPYGDIFIDNANSKQLDWTSKIDISEIKLTPLTNLNKNTILKFVEDEEDYAFRVYKNSISNFLYGSKEFDASGFTILQGMDEIVAEPFAATIPKALMTQFPDFITPSIYSYNADDNTSEGFDNSPRIMFNNGIKTLNSCTYFIPAQNGVTSEDADSFLQFSHLTNVPTLANSRDFHFGECQYFLGVGNTTPNNLFNLYWLPYFNELYNADTRTMTLKVNITPGDINTFNFFDIVFIKNRKFRVNKIDYKPNDLATVEFILIP